jgi:hypothetical protein
MLYRSTPLLLVGVALLGCGRSETPAPLKSVPSEKSVPRVENQSPPAESATLVTLQVEGMV